MTTISATTLIYWSTDNYSTVQPYSYFVTIYGKEGIDSVLNGNCPSRFHAIALSDSEQTIYEAVMREFPATSHESALNTAFQGGANFQFIPS